LISLELANGSHRLDVMEKCCESSGITTVKVCMHLFALAFSLILSKYTGQLSRGAKSDVIRDFTKKSFVTVMLCSLRAGGEGLNLAVANRTIFLDLWWHVCAEHQAFGRVFRNGQTKETYKHKYFIKNTIDQRILALQESKAAEIGTVIRADGQPRESYTEAEVASLFGKAIVDRDGNLLRIDPDRFASTPLSQEVVERD
jgi:SNF2 family DNA or RNA helicase